MVLPPAAAPATAPGTADSGLTVASRTVVVLSVRAPHAVPAAALPALRDAALVVADRTVPRRGGRRRRCVPRRGRPGGRGLLTTDHEHPTIPSADTVVRAPEPPGAALLDAVAVMDRLRSPGGCPWDAEQTHASLLQYLVEECYELYEAIEDGDRDAMREELGDVLLQVLFHARIAAESDPTEAGAPFDIDDVATDLVAKLVGRHPHVFAGTEQIDSAQRQEHRWEELKRAEKQRESSVDGVPLGQPAVALAAKLTSRTARAGLPRRAAACRQGRGGAAVRGRRLGKARRHRSRGRAARGCPAVRRSRPHRRAQRCGRRRRSARPRRGGVAAPLAASGKLIADPLRIVMIRMRGRWLI